MKIQKLDTTDASWAEPQDTRIAIGGLMRCCTGTLDKLLTFADRVLIGETVSCEFCNETMTLDDHLVWNWDNRPTT